MSEHEDPRPIADRPAAPPTGALAQAACGLQSEALAALLDHSEDLTGAAVRLCRSLEARLPGRRCAIAARGDDDRLAIVAAPGFEPAETCALAGLLGHPATPGHPGAALSPALARGPGETQIRAGGPTLRCYPIPGPAGRSPGLLAVADATAAPRPDESALLELAASLAAVLLETHQVRAQNSLLASLSDLMAGYRPPHEQIRALLEFGCRTLGAESAVLGEIQQDRYRLLTAFGNRPGTLGPGETAALRSETLAALGSLEGLLDAATQGDAGEGPAPVGLPGPELPPGSGLRAAALLHWTDADGTPHTGTLSFAPVPAGRRIDGERRQIVGLVGQRIASSLRERAVLDGLLAARQKEIVGHLASGVAHDFNNMIGVVDINLDYLRELLPQTGLDPEVWEILDETRLATRHAKVVTAGMLSLSRRPSAAPRATDLSDAVERFVHSLGRILPADIAIATRIEPQVAALADPGLLQSALLNLIINARDAMAGQGRLEIGVARVSLPSARTLPLGSLEPGEYAELTVADSGSGMPSEVLARIFEPLFSTKAQGRGTGLGLFMVRELALRWGGGVDVDSKPGQGSRFRLYLPAAEGLPEEPFGPDDRPPRPAPVGTPGRVLVVDDDSSMRLILGHLLEHHGYRVDEAGDGVQALALLAAGPPCDLVLTDIVMPNMDGIELHRRLARDYPRLPVILMTADEHQSVEAAGLPVGTVILFKPLAHRLLLSKIQERLPGR